MASYFKELLSIHSKTMFLCRLILPVIFLSQWSVAVASHHLSTGVGQHYVNLTRCQPKGKWGICMCSLHRWVNDSEIHIAALLRTINPEDKINHLAEAGPDSTGWVKTDPWEPYPLKRCLLTPVRAPNKRCVWFPWWRPCQRLFEWTAGPHLAKGEVLTPDPGFTTPKGGHF